jgi:hypothetical protein
MEVDESLRHHGIPFGHQDRRVAGCIEAVSPTVCRVDRQGTLMIAAVDMAIGSHVFAHVHWIAQF